MPPSHYDITWCTLVHKLRKIEPEFRFTQRAALTLGFAMDSSYQHHDDIIIISCGCRCHRPVTNVQMVNICVCIESTDELESSSELYQAISELPQPNRDTLAYLILHLHRSLLITTVFSV